ncbi:hypothetical protein CPB85DRAFT_1439900 [Mucidula mucida]|nr:hypothetical protein CPB85DRAFT_1439900 [Mucidula mucida]
MSSIIEDSGYTIAEAQYSFKHGMLHSTILFAFCHAIHTCIYFLALHYIASSTLPKRKRSVFAGIITFMWGTNNIMLGLNWSWLNSLFIVHGESVESEFEYQFFGDLPGAELASVLRALEVLLTDSILVWRCWILYGHNRMVWAALGLCFTFEIVSSAIILSDVDPATRLCTLLILFRIIRVSGVRASLKSYRGLIEILVESVFMYALVYSTLLSVYAYEFYSPYVSVMAVYSYPQVISWSVTGIAPTLIIARVVAGKSRPNDTWTRPSLPHMRSDMQSFAESLQFADGPNQTATGHTTTIIGMECARGSFESGPGYRYR